MKSEAYLRLQSILSKYPRIHQFLDDDFIREQCEDRLKCFILMRLDNEKSSHSTRQHLPFLESRLAELALVVGYDKLESLLRGASDWDKYQEALAQIDITLWFKQKSLLKEIEPGLPCSTGVGDILLTFSQQDIYCEVTSRESLQKSIESKKGSKVQKIQNLLKRQPWMTQQDAENEIEIDRILRTLLRKTSKQLPANHPGILALDAGKGAVFHHKIKRVAKKLLPQRLQVMLLMLWTSERGSQIGEPPFWFVNPNPPYQNIGQELLKYLGQDNKALDCKD